ncbi:hypothetical protein NUV26_10735 [Burkholderia pseudomultivorans]|uniref:hypothetical protein n=1 Tax=Burkholderia pseudomultivorans TaxID=1207504 RepID=UPI001581C0F5|nr:hypothetical protein [Burkholderia pseudomultivorans]MDS0792630.1 hypothetical protein [Burkholderia pseudomultivorans]
MVRVPRDTGPFVKLLDRGVAGEHDGFDARDDDEADQAALPEPVRANGPTEAEQRHDDDQADCRDECQKHRNGKARDSIEHQRWSSFYPAAKCVSKRREEARGRIIATSLTADDPKRPIRAQSPATVGFDVESISL